MITSRVPFARIRTARSGRNRDFRRGCRDVRTMAATEHCALRRQRKRANDNNSIRGKKTNNRNGGEKVSLLVHYYIVCYKTGGKKKKMVYEYRNEFRVRYVCARDRDGLAALDVFTGRGPWLRHPANRAAVVDRRAPKSRRLTRTAAARVRGYPWFIVITWDGCFPVLIVFKTTEKTTAVVIFGPE